MHERGVDLAEFDPSTADLDLVVGASHEVEAVVFEPDQVTAAVGAAPRQRRECAVLLGVLLRVEVAGQPDPADHQLADLADGHRVPGGVDDGQVPAGQRQPDADGPGSGEPRRARHHGGFGGAVGVPHLPALDGQARGQLRWARLAAEDQQPHRFERLGGPQRGQRRHRGDHGDVARYQPRAQVHTAAHQRARRRNQACPVSPGQPHLLARRIECHRQPGQHPVTRAERVVLQEHLGLGVDERRGVAVGDRDALRGARRPRGEDDPGVVAAQRSRGTPSARRTGAPDQAAFGDHSHDVGLGEHQFGPLGRIVGVDGHVRRARGEGGQDRDVERIAARRHPDADAVAAADAAHRQPRHAVLDVGDQLGIRELHGAVVQSRRVGVAPRGVVEDVDQRARGRGLGRQQVLVGDLRGWIRCCHGYKVLIARGCFSPSGGR